VIDNNEYKGIRVLKQWIIWKEICIDMILYVEKTLGIFYEKCKYGSTCWNMILVLISTLLVVLFYKGFINVNNKCGLLTEKWY